MTEKEYDKPVWSYPDSLGPAIYYGHIPEFNGLIPPYAGRQTRGVGRGNVEEIGSHGEFTRELQPPAPLEPVAV